MMLSFGLELKNYCISLCYFRGLMYFPNWHAQQPQGYCACQFGMHRSYRADVHANLKTTLFGL